MTTRSKVSAPIPTREVEVIARLGDPELVVWTDDDHAVLFNLPARLHVVGEGPVDVRLTAGLDDKRVVITEVVLTARGGVEASALRAVALPTLLDYLLSDATVAVPARRSTQQELAKSDREWQPTEGEVDPGHLALAKRRQQIGRGLRHDPKVLKQVAQAFSDAPAGSGGEAVSMAMHVSAGYAKRLVRAAREAGFLEHSARSRP